MSKITTVATIGLLILAAAASANEDDTMSYPSTKRDVIEEEHFGTPVSDPYRWLERDIRRDPDVALWVEAQNSLSETYLAGLPGREVFHDRLTALYDYARVSAPQKRGNRYFFTRNSGLQSQPTLFMREGSDGAAHVVIDPNEWSEDRTTALADMAPSHDGTHVAFAVQESGAD